MERFDCWTHAVVMLYAVIMRFDSLREISASLQAEARKFNYLGISMMTSRSTLSDANKRRSEAIIEFIYRDLYATYHNLLFKGVGRHPKTWKKKGGIKVHTVIHANEGVPSDIKLTSVATNDMEYDTAEIVDIYQQRWEIVLLFKQMKQNLPLKYFYGESAYAIMIQIWITLIANLLLMF